MKKIVIVWPGYTGYLGPCLRALAKLCELKVYIEPSVYEQRFDAATLDGVEFCRAEGADSAKVIDEIRAFAPDLTILCGWATPLVRAVARASFSGRKVLAFDMPWEWSLRKFVARWALRSYLRNFDAAFVPGERCARYARWLGFRGRRLVLGANPSGWERFGEQKELPNEPPREGFLFAGRFVAAKGLGVLLKAYSLYRQRSAAPWGLDFVGSGDTLPANLPEGVRVLGFISPHEMPRILRAHHCLVLPSLWEPWGVSAAEAMSAERATILSAACGLVDDVMPTRVVPPRNVEALARAMACIAALSSSELQREGRRARAAMAPFSAAHWARRVMGFLEEEARPKRIAHLLAGLNKASGVANIARRFVRVQQERGDAPRLLAPALKWNPIYFGLGFAIRAWRAAREADEIWVHCSWTFPIWWGAFLAKRWNKKLVVVPEGSFDPQRLMNHAGWKKRLVAPVDRWVLRQASEVLALCPDEMEWVRAFEPQSRVRFEQVPIFLPSEMSKVSKVVGARHILFVGRANDALKGVRFLERAIQELNEELGAKGGERAIELRIVSSHFGEELERDWAWCDVFCLPTLSENFGLVVAEALERGKRVITTDGASAWETWANRLCYLRGYREGTDDERVASLREALRVECGI